MFIIAILLTISSSANNPQNSQQSRLVHSKKNSTLHVLSCINDLSAPFGPLSRDMAALTSTIIVPASPSKVKITGEVQSFYFFYSPYFSHG